MSDLATLRAQARATTNPATRRRLVARITEEKVRSNVGSCTQCPLHSTRTQTVPWEGKTHGRAEIVLVGDAPGVKEDESGVPFAGRAGGLLDRLLVLAGTERDRVALVNLIACTPGRQNPSDKEIAACRPNFTAQLDLVGCWVGVLFGGEAVAAVLGGGVGDVSSYHMKPVWKDGRIWVATYHPSYALSTKKKAEAEAAITASISFALSIRFGKTTLPTPPWEQVMAHHPDPHKKYHDHYEKKGWALVYSHSLKQQIVIWDKEKRGLKVPSAITHLPRYTVEELIAMGEAANQTRDPIETVRKMHMVKQEFNGTVLLR